MNAQFKRKTMLLLLGAALVAVIFHLNAIIIFLGKLITLFLPVIIGGILALFLNVPTSGVENLLRRIVSKHGKSGSDFLLRLFALLITVISVILLLVFVFTMLIPELSNSVVGAYEMLKKRLPEWIAYLDSLNLTWLENALESIDVEQITGKLGGWINTFFSRVANVVSSAASTVMSAVFGLITGIYMTLDKRRICRHTGILVRAYLPKHLGDTITHFCRKFSVYFSRFLSGQCMEAALLGFLMFLAFTLFGLPYASLIGVLTAVCAIIPYIGAVMSCTITIVLTLLYNPSLAIFSALVYLAVQFIENQFIYPKVVGGSVGLPPLYTLVSAMIGGRLFGILGIIFFIPLVAVSLELIKSDAENRLNINPT